MKKYGEKILEGALSEVGKFLLLMLGAAAVFVVNWARGISLTYRAILLGLLCCLGFLFLVVSYRRREKKKLELDRQVAVDAETRKRASGAFGSEEIRSMAFTLPPNPEDPTDHSAGENFFG